MHLSWLHRETGQVSSLSLVCGDGMLASHKLVLATVSPFLRTILADIPTGDHVTIIMPDFGVDEVELFLQRIISEEVTNNFHLNLAFGKTIQVNRSCHYHSVLPFNLISCCRFL